MLLLLLAKLNFSTALAAAADDQHCANKLMIPPAPPLLLLLILLVFAVTAEGDPAVLPANFPPAFAFLWC
jgi:hypothetical protein